MLGSSFQPRTTHHAHPGAEGPDHHSVRTEEAACYSWRCIPPDSAVSCLGVAAAMARKVLAPTHLGRSWFCSCYRDTELLAISALRARTATGFSGSCRCTARPLPRASALESCCCGVT
ncbi:uncharacterized protein [Symphalangus syndactylus]|uniref:uncharacterized protein n=1 Tax=Symphalangus syndactylus TaxID=9590 RepID=UPI002442F306|nr:uncharacterized protein LOC129459921 [Symphalangus syndactylus]